MPRAAEVQTIIEFTHRVSSGVALLAVLGLWGLSRRLYPAGHQVRLGAGLSLIFIIIEALLGAGLVLFELVAENDSWFRAVSMVAHLVNTFILVGVLSLTAWWASGGGVPRMRANHGGGGHLAVAALGILVVGATGAIAALGDTLFPSDTLGEGIRNSFSADSHPLIQLRKYHPLLAILLGLYAVAVARGLARRVPTKSVRRLAAAAAAIYVAQILAGTANMVLLAPVSLQLLHLLLADLLWICLVLLGAAALTPPAETFVPSGQDAASLSPPREAGGAAALT